MAKYHINDSGEAGECHAQKGGCPFGGEENHFTSAEAAREDFESQQKPFTALRKDPQEETELKWPADPQEPNWMYKTQANAIAHYSTAHNEGNTVYEQELGLDGTVSLKMSSWPRANEAKMALEKKGYLVEFGRNDMGQWIHVSPLPRESETLDSSKMKWDDNSNSFLISSSAVSPVIGDPRAIYSPKLQETIALDVIEKNPNAKSGETMLRLKPKFQDVNWTVKIINN